jgi:putative intracellular protease/amidase
MTGKTKLSRRAVSTMLGGAAAALTAAIGQAQTTADQPYHARELPLDGQPREQVLMLIYPGFTALDLIGPQYAFGSMVGATVRLVSKSREPVKSDTGVVMLPDLTFAEAPKDVDILFAPGGLRGTLDAMADRETIAFLKDIGSRARHVTSVCTGSLLLGAAGLLEGYRSASHWLTLDLLPLLKAIPVAERVVIDRNRITGGGVTAGIDFGLTLIARLRGDAYAQAVQLLAEYDPAPPFPGAGNPRTAPAEAKQMLDRIFVTFRQDARLAAEIAGKRL